MRSDFHHLNQVVINLEAVTDVFVGNYGSGQVAHDLVHDDQNAPIIFRVESYRLYVWVDFAPLLRPVGPDLFRPTNKTAFERSRPRHIRSHQSEGRANVPCVEGGVGGAE